MELTLEEVRPIIKYIIKNNEDLQLNGQLPIAVNICGEAGIGKTSIIEQIAQEINANFVKLNLSQISEPSDLVGWPIKEHYVCRTIPDDPNNPDGLVNSECRWITAELIEAYAKAGWEITDETRMGYAIPAWLKGLDENRPTIFLLDDFSRATPAILQAVMEITCRQEYISWKLPPRSSVILSTNPDNGDYSVSSFDEAQATRFVTFNVKFSANGWAKWAERQHIDGRAINFLLTYHHELMDKSVAKQSKINARNFTMFSNIISGIKDWSKPENLASILQIASGCFLDEDDIVGGLFTTFIANKLDKLLPPEDLVQKDWDYVKNVLENQLYDGDKYRADIASVITTRFVNYSLVYLSKTGSKTDLITDRIINLVYNNKLLLTEDLIFSLVKTLNKKYPGKCNKLLLNPKLAKKLI